MATVRNLGGAYQISLGDNPSDDGAEYELPKQGFFKTQGEMTRAMRDGRYKTSEGYRKVVKQMIGNSDQVALGLAPAPTGDRSEFEKQKTDMAREMFRDARYKTDARYRAQVMEACASQEADQFFPELSQAQVNRTQGVRSFEVESKRPIPGRVNPNAKRDEEGNLK